MQYALLYTHSRMVSKVKASTHNTMVKEVIQRCKRACIPAAILDNQTHRTIGQVLYLKHRWQFIETKTKARR